MNLLYNSLSAITLKLNFESKKKNNINVVPGVEYEKIKKKVFFFFKTTYP